MYIDNMKVRDNMNSEELKDFISYIQEIQSETEDI